MRTRSRGDELIIAYRDQLLAGERDFVLPEVLARAELEWLGPSAVRSLLEAFGQRLPNSREPERTARLMAYLQDRVAAGAIVVVRRA